MIIPDDKILGSPSTAQFIQSFDSMHCSDDDAVNWIW